YLNRHRLHVPDEISRRRSWHSIPKPIAFCSAAAALPLFFAIACQRSESLKIYHLFPEIDFCPDTLESSHAYLKPSAVWAQDLRRYPTIFSSFERHLRNASSHSHP